MDLVQLVRYHLWAEEQYLGYIQTLHDRQYQGKIEDYDKSIHDILSHLGSVYRFWFNQLGVEFDEVMEHNKLGREKLHSVLRGYQDQLTHMIEGGSDLDVDEVIGVFDIDEPLKTTPKHVIFNFITHSAYHRGQLALLLRVFGFDKIEETDFNPFIFTQEQEYFDSTE